MTTKANLSTPGYRVSVVIPTLNEARNLPHVLNRLPTDVHEIIVVDGHSVDDTVAVARRLRPDVRTIMQTRKGKGNALACGFAAATGDIIAMVDADGSADPLEIPRREPGSPVVGAAPTSPGYEPWATGRSALSST
jgi:glycosyltransferase involved in cell wall biosynthesis